MLLAEATPKIWSSGRTLELGLQRSGSTQVQGLQNRPPSHQCNPTNSQFGKRERDLTYFACKRTRSGTIQAALPLERCFVEVMKLNLGRDSEARFGQDFEF